MSHDVFAVRPTPTQASAYTHFDDPGVIETRIWLEEHDWLYGVLRSASNVSPTFRFPDLISACVSIVFKQSDAPWRIFGILRTDFVMRAQDTPRRRQTMWRQQYQLLLDLQRSPHNQHPHPMHQLDQLTTACVALCRELDDAPFTILRQARMNMVERSKRKLDLLL